MSDRLTISRLRNCVAALAQSKIMIFETSILYAYEASLQLGYEVREICNIFFFVQKLTKTVSQLTVT